jgi:hypothetical protein
MSDSQALGMPTSKRYSLLDLVGSCCESTLWISRPCRARIRAAAALARMAAARFVLSQKGSVRVCLFGLFPLATLFRRELFHT